MVSKDIYEFMKKNPQYVLNSKQIATLTGLKQHAASNCLYKLFKQGYISRRHIGRNEYLYWYRKEEENGTKD